MRHHFIGAKRQCRIATITLLSGAGYAPACAPKKAHVAMISIDGVVGTGVPRIVSADHPIATTTLLLIGTVDVQHVGRIANPSYAYKRHRLVFYCCWSCLV